MADVLDVYVFRDPHFAPDGNTLVCVAPRRGLTRFMSKREVSRAFGGCAVYRRPLWTTFVGVWGERNGSRFRRFLRERGAELTIHKEAPPSARLLYWTTKDHRPKVRSLSERLCPLSTHCGHKRLTFAYDPFGPSRSGRRVTALAFGFEILSQGDDKTMGGLNALR